MKNKNAIIKKCSGTLHILLMATCLRGFTEKKLFLRLSDSDIAKIMKDCKDVSAFEPMPERAMKGYVVLPKPIYSIDKLFWRMAG